MGVSSCERLQRSALQSWVNPSLILRSPARVRSRPPRLRRAPLYGGGYSSYIRVSFVERRYCAGELLAHHRLQVGSDAEAICREFVAHSLELMGLELDPSIFVVRVGDCLVCRAADLERVSINDPATSQADAGAAIPWTKSSLDYEALVIAAGKALISLGVSATALPLAVHCFENVLRSNGGICEQEVRPIEVVCHEL